MSNKSKSRKPRDFEAEREELLAVMSKRISTDTKDRIDAAVKAATIVEEFKVTVSHEGTADANIK